MNLCHMCSRHWCNGLIPFKLKRLNYLQSLQAQQHNLSYNTTTISTKSFYLNKNTSQLNPSLTKKCQKLVTANEHIMNNLIPSQVPFLSSQKCPLYFNHRTIFFSRTIKLDKSHSLSANLSLKPYTSKACDNDLEILKLRKEIQCLRQQSSKYILKMDFARILRNKIWPGDSLKNETSQVVEISAGAGVLTRCLLEGGVENLIAIEKEPELNLLLTQLKAEQGTCYQVVIGDSLTVLRTLKSLRDANVNLSAIFEHEHNFKNWHGEPVIKVVGSIAVKKTERTSLYTIVSLLLQKIGVFKFGPVEFNLLIFQRTLETLTQEPTSNMSRYQAISVLIQIGFDIECLHTVKLSSLLFQENTSQHKNENVCLVRLKPKIELITENSLSADEASLFIFFVRNLMTKRKQNLLQVLEVWAPGSGHILIDLGYNKHTRTGDVKAMDYLRMFTRILPMDSFNGHWIGEEIMDHSAMVDEIENSVLQDMY